MDGVVASMLKANDVVAKQDDAPDCIGKLRGSLKRQFQKKATVHLPGDIHETKPKTYESEEVPLDDVYVRLLILEKSQLEQGVGGSASETERMMHVFFDMAPNLACDQLGQILKLASEEKRRLLKKDGVRVLALAGAGVGKTMAFLRKGPLEWARGNIWKDMALVFAFPLRRPSVHSAKDLEELLCLSRHGFHRQSDQEDICEYISENMARVCFILDGLDEVDLCKCSDFIQGLIQGDEMDGLRLIVTSRPSIPVMELVKANPFNLRVEVLGFSEDELRRYVGKVLIPDQKTKLMQHIATSPPLAAYMQTPVNAANVCMLYRTGVTTVPTSLTHIVTAILRQVLVQNESREKRPRHVADHWKDINPILLEPINELAAFAFKMLVDKVTVFEKRHFEENQLSDKAQFLGLFVASDDNCADSPPLFIFTHLSMQEALGARHIASSIVDDEIRWLVRDLGSLTGHLNTFWRFLAAGLSARGVDELICALLTRAVHKPPAVLLDTDVADVYVDRICQTLGDSFSIINPDTIAKPIPRDFIKKYVKPRDKDLPQPKQQGRCSQLPHFFFSASHSEMCRLSAKLSEHIDIATAEKLADHLLMGVTEGSGVQLVLAALPRGRDLNGAAFIRELIMIWKRRVPRASIHALYRAVAELNQSAAMNCFPDLADATAANSNPDELVDISTEEGKQLLLLACHCYQEYSANASGTLLLPRFRDILRDLGKIELRNTRLTSSDCRAISSVLQHNYYNQVISHLGFGNSFMGNTGYSQLSQGIAACRGLSKLYLYGNRLTDMHARHVAMVIRYNAPTLLHLHTTGNQFTSAGNAIVHGNTGMCHQLQLIGVGGPECGDLPLNASTICNVLSGCRRIQALILNELKLGVDGIGQLQLALASHRLYWLVFLRIGLTGEYASAMSRLLQQQRRYLQSVSFSGNALTSPFLFGIHNAFQQCSEMRHLRMFNTKLTSSTLSLMAVWLRSWPLLRELAISNNDFRDVGTETATFAAAVRAAPSLQSLWMPGRRLVDLRLAEILVLRTQRRHPIVKFEEVTWWSARKNGCKRAEKFSRTALGDEEGKS